MNNRRNRKWFVHFGERTPRADSHKLHVVPGRPKWDLVTLGGAVGLVGGPIAATVGLLFLVINGGLKLVGRTTHPVLQTVGSVLLIPIIPLVMIGAHCLDKLDERITNNLRPSPNGYPTVRSPRGSPALGARAK